MKLLNSLFLLTCLAQPGLSLASSYNDEALDDGPRTIYTQQPSWWMNLGVGAGTTFNNDNGNIGGGPALQLSFNGLLSQKLLFTVYENAIGTHSNDAFDAGIMLGVVKRTPNWYYSGSAGVCYTKLEHYHHYNNYYYDNYYWYPEKKSSAGVPVQLQAFWTPFRHFGIGLIGHGVISPNPYVNALVAIQIYG